MAVVILTQLYPLFRQAVVNQFTGQPGFELQDAGLHVDTLEQHIGQYRPRLVIADLDLIESDGVHPRINRICPAYPLLQRWHALWPETQFLILATHANHILIGNTIELGIGGYLLKCDEFTLHMPDVVRIICDGGCAFSQALVNLKDTLPELPLGPLLTARQIDILKAIVTNPNLTYGDQARRLEISKHTFDTHLRSIFQKLVVSNLTAAILTAVRLGIIPYYSLCWQYDPSGVISSSGNDIVPDITDLSKPTAGG
jgi:DNA-binding NarL/FixJ family response regulator